VTSLPAECVVADAGPLIALARIEGLGILRGVFRRVLVPPAVFSELEVTSVRPGAVALADAVAQGWLRRAKIDRVPARLGHALDPGEAEAIALAKQRGMLLLIDERRGRTAARLERVPIIGTGALFVVAKRRGLLPEVRPVLDALIESGYRLSPSLVTEILNLAGEIS